MASNPDIEHIGLIKVEHVECHVVKKYEYNNVFGNIPYYPWATPGHLLSVSKRSKQALRWLCVDQPFIFSSMLKDCPIIKEHHHYTSNFGPCFHGKWLIYENTRRNLDLAFTRITNVRENAAKDTLLRANLIRSHGRRTGRLLHSALGKIRERMRVPLLRIANVFEEQEFYSRVTHAKKRIRMLAMRELIDRAAGDTLFTEQIVGKIKLFERAKNGKYPRLIGDYSTPGSLLGGFLCEIAKENFGRFVTKRGFTSQYVSTADADVFREIGENLVSANTDTHFFFSDDGLFNLRGEIIEMDISSCDISNAEPVFNSLISLFSDFPQFHEVIKKCVDQCKLSIVLRDPCNHRTKVRFKGVKPGTIAEPRPIEYSGSVLTTLLNNIASMSIGLVMHARKARNDASIHRCAIAAGYIVTLNRRSCLETAQFLKHSWFFCEDTNRVESFLNLGAMMRSFGTCQGDLPMCGRTIAERAHNWNSAVVAGYVHSGRTRVLQILQEKYNSRVDVNLPDYITKHFTSGERGTVPDSAVLRRYGITHAAWEHFISLLKCSSTGDVIKHDVLDQIYLVDYGLE